MPKIEPELKDLLTRIQPTIRLRKITVGISLIMAVELLIGKIVFHPEQTAEIIVVLIIWFFSIFLLELLTRKQKTASGVSNLYFSYTILELFLTTLIVYNSGGVEWMGAMFFLFIIVYGNIVLSKTKGFIVSTVAVIFYLSLVFLEYFEFIPFKEFFPIGVNLYKDPLYLLNAVPFVVFTFYLVGLAASLFTGLLRERAIELEEAKTVLEIKVKARTRELETLAEEREETIEEKTRELRGKIEELERFYRLVVGRELKMVELKEDIKKLKKELTQTEKQKKR